MDPLISSVVLRRVGLIVLKLYRAQRRHRYLRYLYSGCLLLAILSFLIVSFLISGIPTIVTAFVVPPVELSHWENVPEAIRHATSHWTGRDGPLPRDIILTPELEAFAQAAGMYNQKSLDPYYQLQSCIAAADYIGFPREQLCAVSLMEGGWVYPELESRTFTTAVSVARGLLMLREEAIREGYKDNGFQIEWVLKDAEGNKCDEEGKIIGAETDEGSEEEPALCVEPIERECENAICVAYLSYFGNNDLVDTLDTLSGNIQVVNQATVADYDGEWPPLLYWTYVNLGLDDAFILGTTGGEGVVYVDGIPVILEPGEPPPNNLPYLRDGFLVHPVAGGNVSGYRFRSGHPGTDYSRKPTGWAVAVCNGEVTFVGWDSDGYGNYVKFKCPLPEGGSICSLYAHGRTRTPREVGSKLDAGDGILEIGSTGKSSGPHLHFEIGDCKNRFDPEKFLPAQ